MWHMLVLFEPMASRLGRQCRSGDESEALSIITDMLAEKATNTVKQRAFSLLQFVRWLQTVRDGAPWPLVEAEAYNYVVNLRQLAAPATRANRFLEAVTFAVPCHRPAD